MLDSDFCKFYSMDRYEILVLNIPVAAKRNIRQAVHYSLLDHFPDEKNKLLFEYRKISHDSKSLRIAVVAYHEPEEIPAFGNVLSGLLALATANDLKTEKKIGTSVIVECGSEFIHVSFDNNTQIASVEQIHKRQEGYLECAVFIKAELSKKNKGFSRARINTLKRKLEQENLKTIIAGVTALLISLSLLSFNLLIKASIEMDIKTEQILQKQIESINERIDLSIDEILHLNNDLPCTGFAFLLTHLSSLILTNSQISEFRADDETFTLMITGSTAGNLQAQIMESSPALHDIRLRNLRLLNNGKESYTIEGKYRISASIPFEVLK